MKKSKLITTLLLVVVLLVVMMSTLTACDWIKKNPEEGEGGGTNRPNLPPTPPPDQGKDDNVVPTYNAMGMLEKAVASIDSPEKAVGIDLGIDYVAPDGKKTTLALRGNIYEESTEMSFIVYQSLANQETRERVFGIYAINGKLFVDLGEGKSLLYLEDFNVDYIAQLADKGIDKVLELLENSGFGLDTIIGFLPLIMPLLCEIPVVEVTADGGQNISMVFDIKGFLGNIPGLLDDLLGTFGVTLPVDLGPFVEYLAGLLPSGEYKLLSNYDASGALTYFGMTIDDNYEDKHTNLDFNLDVKAEAVDTNIPEIDESALVNFSLTNIQFSIDITAGTQVDKDGNPAQLDVGRVVNDILGLLGNNEVVLPSNLLLLQGGTGLRLSFAIDLDLNYNKAPEDNNKIAIELFLLKQDGTLADGEGSRPQAGIYYTDGSLYVNLDNLLPNYMKNINLKVDTNLNTLISALVDMITNAIDGALGTDFQEIVGKSGAKVSNDGSVALSSQQDLERVLSTANVDVLAYSLDEEGNYVVNAGFKNFLNAVLTLVGFQECVKYEGSKIIITADENFFEAIESLIGSELGFRFPSFLPAVSLTLDLFEGGLKSIAVDATVSSTLDVELKIHEFLICYEDLGLKDRIENGINKENTSYINHLNGVVDTLLSGIMLSTSFEMKFNKGKYNLAPFIASFGLDQIADADIIWNFTDDFLMDMSINVQIDMRRDDPDNSTLVFELNADEDVQIGENVILKKGTLLGIYGYKNSIYIDLSGFSILNLTLPKLKFDLPFSQLVYSLIDDVIASLLTSMDIEGGDLMFEFDLGSLLGLSSAPATIATADGDSNLPTANVNQEIAAIVLSVSTEKIAPMITMATIMRIVDIVSPGAIDSALEEALKLMEIQLDLSMGRKDGFVFDFTGNLIPVMIEYPEDPQTGKRADSICVFYKDENGNRLPTHDEDGKKIVYQNKSKDDPNYYVTKEYNYLHADGRDSGFHLRFEMGTENARVVIGEIPADKKYDFARLDQDINSYRSDLLEAIMDTVGTGSLDLMITLLTKDSKMDLQRMINTILASVGKRLELPIWLNLDEWEANVRLVLQWDIDLLRADRNLIKFELQYYGSASVYGANGDLRDGKIILGVYIYESDLILDLRGLGLISARLTNSNIIDNIFGMITGFVNEIQGMDLNEIINDLLKDIDLPTLPGAGSTEGGDEIATDDNMSTIGENFEVMDLVKYILQAVSLENTGIALNFTSTLISTLLNELVGINLGIDFTVGGGLDLFDSELDLDIGVQDIELKASLKLDIGKDVDIVIKDIDDIPDWDASTGRVLAQTMLDTLDIGLTLDLSNNTSDARAVSSGDAGHTRITVKKAGAGERLNGVDGNPTVTKGSLVVKISQINTEKYMDNTKGTEKNIAYLVLDYTKESKQMKAYICTNVISFDILVTKIDFGTIDAINNALNFDMDLLGMLGGMFEGLLTQIDGIFGDNDEPSQPVEPTEPTEPTEPGEETPSEPGPFDEIFANFDIIKLLSGGINVSLRSNGNFNVDATFDPYTINRLIDDILGTIFSADPATGNYRESGLNLATMAPDMFSEDHLGHVVWSRMEPGSDSNKKSFWGSLRAQLSPLLQDVLEAVGYGGLKGLVTDTLLGQIYTQVGSLLRPLLPFAVFNEFNVGVNVVDSTLANIYVIGNDNNEPIYKDEAKTQVATEYPVNTGARGDENYTEIWIYNMFKAVGNASNALPDATGNDAQGVVTWDDIPSRIEYSPYTYVNDEAGVAEIIATHFTDKEASYQHGGDQHLIRGAVTFYMKKYRTSDDGDWRDYAADGNGNPTLAVTQERLLNALSNKGTYVIEARATFGTIITRTMEVTITALGTGGGIQRIESFSMHVYDELPDFITAVMRDGTTRKIRTDRLQILNKEGTGKVKPAQFKEDHEVEALVRFPREGVADQSVIITYLNSSVDAVIVNGEAVSAKDGNTPRLVVDLYDYNLTELSGVADYVSDYFYFKYSDGKAEGLKVNGAWEYDEEEIAGLYDRIKNAELGKIDENGYLHNVDGTAFIVTNTIGSAEDNTLQTVSLIVWVRTKNVSKLTINGLENTLRIDPYQYYMYLITGDEAYNPFPDTALANYNGTYAMPGLDELYTDDNDGKQEEVFITWNEEDYTSINFTAINDNSYSKNIRVSLDNSQYQGNFTWDFDTKIVVLRNEIQAVYFDEELTQSTFFIDPFEYLLQEEHGVKKQVTYPSKEESIYPSTAWVLFTNGRSIEMPIEWEGLDKFVIDDYSSRVAQLKVKIGFDIDGKLQGKVGEGTQLEQSVYVNVKVENLQPAGLDVAGSEYNKDKAGKEIFYIDPIQVLYYGMNPFPESVTMVYTSGRRTELDVDWDFDMSTITMDGSAGQDLYATITISKDLSYQIKVEVLERAGLKAAVTSIDVDPYRYSMDENGSRVYSNFASTAYVYKELGNVDYDSETGKVTVNGLNQASGNVSGEFDTYVLYEVTYTTGSGERTYTTRSVDSLADFLGRNEWTSAVVKQYYKVNVEWDLREINYAISDTYTVKMITKAKSEYNGVYDESLKVDVNVEVKKVDHVTIQDGYIQIYYGGTNLSEEERLTSTLKRNLAVWFEGEDGVGGTYECTIDLKKVNFTTAYDVELEDGQFKDKSGNVISEDLASYGTDVTVTVCSGDIAQTVTVKAVVIYQVQSE